MKVSASNSNVFYEHSSGRIPGQTGAPRARGHGTNSVNNGQRQEAASPAAEGLADLPDVNTIQAEYKSIQDCYSKKRLPGDLRLNDSRSGIKGPQRKYSERVRVSWKHS